MHIKGDPWLSLHDSSNDCIAFVRPNPMHDGRNSAKKHVQPMIWCTPRCRLNRRCAATMNSAGHPNMIGAPNADPMMDWTTRTPTGSTTAIKSQARWMTDYAIRDSAQENQQQHFPIRNVHHLGKQSYPHPGPVPATHLKRFEVGHEVGHDKPKHKDARIDDKPLQTTLP